MLTATVGRIHMTDRGSTCSKPPPYLEHTFPFLSCMHARLTEIDGNRSIVIQADS